MKKLVAAILVGGATIVVAGCGGSGSSAGSSNSSAGSVSTSDNSQQVIPKTATLVIGAKFPQSDGKIRGAYLDENTVRIDVTIYAGCTTDYYSSCQAYRNVTLTKENPVQTLSNLPIGKIFYSIRSYSSQDGYYWDTLDFLEGKGEIVEGKNTLVATLLRAKWSFVDNEGNPISITLNGTKPDSNESINSLLIIPYGSYYSYSSLSKASIDTAKNHGRSEYTTYYLGSNLDAVGCAGTSCKAYNGLDYYNQFIGPSTNNNAVDGAQLPLIPNPNYPNTYNSNTSSCWYYGDPYDCTNRGAFIIGVPLDYLYYGYYGYTSSQVSFKDVNGNDMTSTINSYAISSVKDANTMEGNIVEFLMKNKSRTNVCYDMDKLTCPDSTEPCQIQCPSYISSQAIRQAIEKAVLKAASKSIKKSQQMQCYNDLSLSERYSWETYNYIYDNNGNYVGYGRIKVDSQTNGTVDACIHSFRAKASPIPSSSLEVTIQNKR